MVPFLGVHSKGDTDIDVGIDTDSEYGWLSKFMVPFWVLSIIRHLVFRAANRGP